MSRRHRLGTATLLAVMAAPGPAAAQVEYLLMGIDTARTGWIGLSVGAPNSIGTVIVAEIAPGAPAQEAGIRVGDRIVTWNGRHDVASAIQATALRPGDRVRLQVARDGEAARDLSLVAVSRPASADRLNTPLPTDSLARERLRRAVLELERLRQLEALHAQERLRDLQLRERNDRLAPAGLDSLRAALRQAQVDLERRVAEQSAAVSRMADAVARQAQIDSTRIMASDAAGLGVSLMFSRNAVAGAELTELSPGLAGYFGTASGALVLRVSPATPAQRAGLQDGDVVVRLADQVVRSPADFRRIYAAQSDGEIAVEFIRRGVRHTGALPTAPAANPFRGVRPAPAPAPPRPPSSPAPPQPPSSPPVRLDPDIAPPPGNAPAPLPFPSSRWVASPAAIGSATEPTSGGRW